MLWFSEFTQKIDKMSIKTKYLLNKERDEHKKYELKNILQTNTKTDKRSDRKKKERLQIDTKNL